MKAFAHRIALAAVLAASSAIIAHANEVPQVILATGSTSGSAPLSVHLDASQSVDPDGEIAGFNWDFGDGQVATGAIVDHTFEVAGQYTVRLTLTDDAGAAATATLAITVESTQAGQAAFTYAMGRRSLEVVFDATPSAIPRSIVSYEWVFGDGSEPMICFAERAHDTPPPAGGGLGTSPPLGTSAGTPPPGTSPPSATPGGPGGAGTRPPPGTPAGSGRAETRLVVDSVRPCPASLGFRHVYPAAGHYFVRLTITDDAGIRHQAIREIDVVRNFPLTFGFDEIPGRTGGAPSSTAIVAYDLDSLPIDRLGTLLVRVHEVQSTPAGAFDGLKLDAFVFSPIACRTASCVAFLPQDEAFVEAEMELWRRGGLPSDPEPIGVVGGNVDSGVATLDVADANASRVNADGFITLPEGTWLLLRFTEQPQTADLFLYTGIIWEDNVELSVDVFAESLSMADLVDERFDASTGPGGGDEWGALEVQMSVADGPVGAPGPTNALMDWAGAAIPTGADSVVGLTAALQSAIASLDARRGVAIREARRRHAFASAVDGMAAGQEAIDVLRFAASHPAIRGPLLRRHAMNADLSATMREASAILASSRGPFAETVVLPGAASHALGDLLARAGAFDGVVVDRDGVVVAATGSGFLPSLHMLPAWQVVVDAAVDEILVGPAMVEPGLGIAFRRIAVPVTTLDGTAIVGWLLAKVVAAAIE